MKRIIHTKLYFTIFSTMCLFLIPVYAGITESFTQTIPVLPQVAAVSEDSLCGNVPTIITHISSVSKLATSTSVNITTSIPSIAGTETQTTTTVSGSLSTTIVPVPGLSSTTTTSLPGSLSTTTTSLPGSLSTTTVTDPGSLSTTTSLLPGTLDILADTKSGYQPLKVRFSYQSYREVSGSHWFFGDMHETTDNPTPVHTYKKVGTYSVILTVTFLDGTTKNVIKRNFISVAPYKCAFVSALKEKGDIHVLRNLRDEMQNNFFWMTLSAIYYNNSTEIVHILEQDYELKKRFIELVLSNIEVAEKLVSEKEAGISEDSLHEIINFLDDLQFEGSTKLQKSIDFIKTEIEYGYMLQGIGIYIT